MPLRRQPVATDRRFRRKNPNSNLRSDYGPPERWQHSGRVLELTEAAGILAARATEEHVVDSLVAKGILTETQRIAAFKLKLDFHCAGLGARVTNSYNPNRGNVDYSHAPDRTDLEEAAYQRWRLAVRETGIRYSAAVITTVCHDMLPVPRDIAALQTGLDLLVRWYRLPEERSYTS